MYSASSSLGLPAFSAGDSLSNHNSCSALLCLCLLERGYHDSLFLSPAESTLYGSQEDVLSGYWVLGGAAHSSACLRRRLSASGYKSFCKHHHNFLWENFTAHIANALSTFCTSSASLPAALEGLSVHRPGKPLHFSGLCKQASNTCLLHLRYLREAMLGSTRACCVSWRLLLLTCTGDAGILCGALGRVAGGMGGGHGGSWAWAGDGGTTWRNGQVGAREASLLAGHLSRRVAGRWSELTCILCGTMQTGLSLNSAACGGWSKLWNAQGSALFPLSLGRLLGC
jgi:hypothetical protein